MKIIASAQVSTPLSVGARTQVRGPFGPETALAAPSGTISLAARSQPAVSLQATGLEIQEP